MSLKDKFENHPVIMGGTIFAAGCAAAAAAIGFLIIGPKNDKIADFEKQDVVKTTKIEALTSEKRNLELSQQTLNSDLAKQQSDSAKSQANADDLSGKNADWQNAYNELLKSYKQSLSNCSVLKQIQDIEQNKNWVESVIQRQSQANPNNDVTQFRRQASELQERLLKLESSLVCTTK